MECQFVVGQKVVCIAKGVWPCYAGFCPVRGGIYTIREIFDGAKIHDGGTIGLRFIEIVNPPVFYQGWRGSGEIGFRPHEFAPLIEPDAGASVIAILAVLWVVIGIGSLIYLSWNYESFTWGDLLTAIVLGSITGPLVILAVGLKVLGDAPFWQQPIFGKRRDG